MALNEPTDSIYIRIIRKSKKFLLDGNTAESLSFLVFRVEYRVKLRSGHDSYYVG